MEPFQQRVLDEQADLMDKLSRLEPFVGYEHFLELSELEQVCLGLQLSLMAGYSAVLTLRINNWNLVL
jgi:hypothetical protein